MVAGLDMVGVVVLGLVDLFRFVPFFFRRFDLDRELLFFLTECRWTSLRSLLF